MDKMPWMKTIRVALADDHPILTAGLKSILEKEPDIEIVGEAKNGREVLDVVKRTKPDLVVLDIGMPEVDGMETAGLLKDGFKEVKILTLSIYDDYDHIMGMLQKGVNGYVLKKKTKGELITAIRMIMDGKLYLSLEVQEVIQKGPPPKSKQDVKFTGREEELMGHLAANPGLSAKELAVIMDIEETTVNTFLRNIKGRLQISKVGDLIKFVLRRYPDL